jgi:hypothetical protein
VSAPDRILSRTRRPRPGGRTARARAFSATAALGILAATVAGFWCYRRLSWTVAATSDGGANALQAQDMLHGNWLLRGWEVSDVSFYTTELPEYIMVELTRRLGPDVIHVSAAVTYTLLVLASGLLARGRARGGDGLARGLIAAGIMLAPQLGFGVGVLLLSPDHTGTQVPLLLGWLVLDLAPRRWYVPVFLGGLLAWVQFADRAALLTGAVPLLVASAALTCRALARGAEFSWRSQSYELSLAAAAAASVAAAWTSARLFAAAGAFTAFPLSFLPGPAGQLPAHLWLTGWGILELYGANLVGIHGALPMFFAVVHMLGLALAVLGCGFACWRFWGFRRDAELIDGVLTAAILCNLASYALSTAPGTVFNSYNAREIAAVLPLGAVLAGRRLGPRLREFPVARPALGALLLCYASALGYGAAQPAVAAQTQELAGWLAARHLSYGLAGQEANIATVDSGGRVHLVMVVTGASENVRPFWYQMKASWYDPRLHFADFLVTATPGGRFETISPAVAYRTFGPPAAVCHFSGYTVMVWHRNLLARLAPLQPVLP